MREIRTSGSVRGEGGQPPRLLDLGHDQEKGKWFAGKEL
jgi:hypothetical protein